MNAPLFTVACNGPLSASAIILLTVGPREHRNHRPWTRSLNMHSYLNFNVTVSLLLFYWPTSILFPYAHFHFDWSRLCVHGLKKKKKNRNDFQSLGPWQLGRSSLDTGQLCHVHFQCFRVTQYYSFHLVSAARELRTAVLCLNDSGNCVHELPSPGY